MSMTRHFPPMMVSSPGVQAQLALGEALQSQKEKAQLPLTVTALSNIHINTIPAPLRHEMAQKAGFLRVSDP